MPRPLDRRAYAGTLCQPWTVRCPLCNGEGDVAVMIRDDNKRRAGYLFNLATFCSCEPRKVIDEITRRAFKRRRRSLGSVPP